MSNKLIVSASPHIRDHATTSTIMRDVLIALAPAMIAATIIFGFRALLMTAVCVAACVFFEYATERILGRTNTISDLSAAVTGVILSINLPVQLPIWMAVLGCYFAIGGIYLIYRKVITVTIPLSFIGGVLVLSVLFGVDPMYELMGGGLLLGAFFMATDYTTSPITEKGKIIFGLGCALITMVIRVFGSYPEGVSYSILLMNIITPHTNRMVRNKAFGGVQQ